MATLVTFHAHPDDESIATGGVMAKAASEGHRVVLVQATRGEHGEVAEGVLRSGEALWERRVEETMAAAEVLGVSRVEFLGYVDSGMAGTPENEAPGCFWRADVEEAATRLAAILREENADILTAYDERGVYDHPDHVQVHRVGVRAAQLAGTPRLFLNTVDRDHFRRQMAELVRLGVAPPGDISSDELDIGVDGHRITTVVDVRPWLGPKRAAMAAHASQIPESSFFLALPPPAFETAFGQEWFILAGHERPAGAERATDLFDGLG